MKHSSRLTNTFSNMIEYDCLAATLYATVCNFRWPNGRQLALAMPGLVAGLARRLTGTSFLAKKIEHSESEAAKMHAR